jgi:uncharacterized membrane-anchored protein YhcB (DUF1043 family)
MNDDKPTWLDWWQFGWQLANTVVLVVGMFGLCCMAHKLSSQAQRQQIEAERLLRESEIQLEKAKEQRP